MCRMWQTGQRDCYTEKVYSRTQQTLLELDHVTPDSIPPKERLDRIAKLASMSKMSEGRGSMSSPHSRMKEGKRNVDVRISGDGNTVTLVDGQRIRATADGPPLPPPGMELEVNRLATFASWPHSAPVSANALARAGFYFTQKGDQVQCFACMGVIEAWEYGDTAIGEHRKHFPRCPFVRDPTYKNQPLRVDGDPSMTKASGEKWAREKSTESPKRTQPRIRKTVSGESLHNKEKKLSEAELTFRSEYKRLLSFRDWPKSSPTEPRDLAKAGFHYLGKDDIVQCFACFGKVQSWEPVDEPLQEHRRHYPSCPFVLGLQTHNEPITTLQACIAAPIIYREPRTLPLSCKPKDTPLPQTARVMGGWEPAPTTPRVLDKPNFSAYSGENARMETFNSPKWPGILGITPKQLARAGFFFTGEEDHTKCFYCGGGLMHWVSTDEPWTEHAKWFPMCDWLLQQRGQTFVSYVVRNFPVNSSKQQGASGVDRKKSRAASATVKKATTPPPASSSGKPQVEEEVAITIKKTPPKIAPKDKAMSSRLAKLVLEMGYSERLVRRVVQARLQATGKEFQSTDDLLEAIFQAEEEEGEGVEEGTPTKTEGSVGLSNKNRPEGQEGASSQRAEAESVAALSQEVANLWTSDPSRTKESGNVNEVKTSRHPGSPEPTEEVLREVERLRDERLCKVCLDNEADIVLLPCTHLVLCNVCASSLSSCPICRQTITKVVKVFKS